VRSERARPAPHDLFHRLVDPLRELVGSKHAKDDPLLVDDDTGVPTGIRNPATNVCDRFI
jgi:hypothetical protein